MTVHFIGLEFTGLMQTGLHKFNSSLNNYDKKHLNIVKFSGIH